MLNTKNIPMLNRFEYYKALLAKPCCVDEALNILGRPLRDAGDIRILKLAAGRAHGLSTLRNYAVAAHKIKERETGWDRGCYLFASLDMCM